ncbi:hypothetical protein H0486_09265 [Lachnospiraceae bacterium MD1]|jgi:g-D-glutamyl-meso-diaminopimelate peptidase|uniref:Peptidase M14 domain-containing protein n=1 Tax=Variimorphobacter saccharofermentans TaxID=2755051 RepID=A0A839K0W5_9FIRM|nr:M14 family zinc carboxypeptidase [Variimorphobacter saccharofermentans]MBB2183067.1 hypothetical protein [Variimorphobacter saccharofermentans]
MINMDEPIYSYDTLIHDTKKLEEQYHSILDCVTIGSSHDNRDIVLLKLGIGEKYIICCSGVHARETINPIVLMRIIEYYSQMYMEYQEHTNRFKTLIKNPTRHIGEEYEQMLYGACIYELLQTFTILFVPLLNPDGYMVSLKGFDEIRNDELRRKCLDYNIPHYEWKFNARGVDINRNFPCKLWRQKDSTDHSASENETKALIDLFHEYKSMGFLDFHSRGKSIYYYRSMMSESYNLKQLKIANRFREITNYDLEVPENEIDSGDSGGNTVHYFSENFHKPALTIETVDEDATFPLDIKYRESTFEELKLMIFEYGSLIL